MKSKVDMLSRFRTRRLVCGLASIVAFAPINPGFASVSKPAAATSPVERWSYADVSDLFLAVPIVARVRVVEAIRLPDTPGTIPAAGRIRYYFVGDVTALIRGSGGLAPRVAWLADVPLDARGKPPKLVKTVMMLAAFPVDGKPAELRLAARDAMMPWSEAAETRVRTVIANGLATDAPPRITGITSAFHSPGNLPGEGETQIFLATASSDPVSLSILRRPGMEPRWAVALGEIVDEAAKPPERDTLAWYRLACSLPAEMPPAATAELSQDGADAARADYKFVIDALGPCTRTRDQS